jgi:hypothetical protein
MGGAGFTGFKRGLPVVVPLVIAIALSACSGNTDGAAGAGSFRGTGVTGEVLGGPTCPSLQRGDEHECASRPVPGAHLLLSDKSGRPITVITSDSRGRFEEALDPGVYTLVAETVEGWLGTPPAVDVVVRRGSMTLIDLTYDTGVG